MKILPIRKIRLQTKEKRKFDIYFRLLKGLKSHTRLSLPPLAIKLFLKQIRNGGGFGGPYFDE